MALKNWSMASLPYKSLVIGGSDLWTASSGGTNEFYYNGTLIGEPNYVGIEGTEVTDSKGNPGILNAAQWGWGDNDSLGHDTIYIRLSDGADPDSKSSDFVKCSEYAQIGQVTVGKDAVIFGLIIANTDTAKDAQLKIAVADSSGVIKFNFFLTIQQGNSPYGQSLKMCLNNEEQLLMLSNIESISVFASLDES